MWQLRATIILKTGSSFALRIYAIYTGECATIKSDMVDINAAGLSACTQWPAAGMVFSDAFGKKLRILFMSESLM
jgi:hypothetical protein